MVPEPVGVGEGLGGVRVAVAFLVGGGANIGFEGLPESPPHPAATTNAIVENITSETILPAIDAMKFLAMRIGIPRLCKIARHLRDWPTRRKRQIRAQLYLTFVRLGRPNFHVL
jgi:hypothetical protein